MVEKRDRWTSDTAQTRRTGQTFDAFRSMQCSLFRCPAIMLSRIWRGAKSWRAVASVILLVACLPVRLGL
jgi:hypothetical protein